MAGLPEVEAVRIKGVMPTQSGCAVFLATEKKTFVIYVDHGIGQAISMAFNGAKKERPLTHDLITTMLAGLEARIEHVTINDVDQGTFFARILLVMENELGRKIVELDARPSDCMVLALQSEKPIFAARKVLDSVEDMTDILTKILAQQADEASSPSNDEDADNDDDDDEDDEDDEDQSEDDEDDDDHGLFSLGVAPAEPGTQKPPTGDPGGSVAFFSIIDDHDDDDDEDDEGDDDDDDDPRPHDEDDDDTPPPSPY